MHRGGEARTGPLGRRPWRMKQGRHPVAGQGTSNSRNRPWQVCAAGRPGLEERGRQSKELVKGIQILRGQPHRLQRALGLLLCVRCESREGVLFVSFCGWVLS